MVPGKQTLGEAEFLEPFMTFRLIAQRILFADDVKGRLQTGGQRLAELRLAGPGRSIDKEIDPLLSGSQGAPQDPFDMVTVFRYMGEVRPTEFARLGLVQQQAPDIRTGFVRKPVQPSQPADEFNSAVCVPGHESRRDERCIGREPLPERIEGDTKKARESPFHGRPT